MKNCFIFLLLCAIVISGCTATARLYPVQGPLSRQTPAPVLVGKLTDGLKSGAISMQVSDTELCKGKWTIVQRPSSTKLASAAPSTTTANLGPEWDIVYGSGFYTAHVLGARLYGRAQLTGSLGTTLTVEIIKPDTGENNAPGSVRGVARDNKENIYKVTF